MCPRFASSRARNDTKFGEIGVYMKDGWVYAVKGGDGEEYAWWLDLCMCIVG